jgi:dienelactone hydrolase
VTDLPQRQAVRRRELYALLGDLPDRHRPIGATKRHEEAREGYWLETWDLDLNGLETVPASVVRPAGLTGLAPAVLFNHSHGGGYDVGRRELVDGRSYLQPVAYAKTLTDLGCIGLCIDHWVFGERATRSESETFKAMLWQGRVLWGMMVYDRLRALDWLAARPDVDASRLGTLGMSMGSTMAWWLAALDEHGVYYYVPSLLKHFTTAGINALIAPRAHLAIAGVRDPLTPPEGVDVIDCELTATYARHGHPERWKLLRYDVGHQETPEGRTAAVEFLKRFL